MQPQAAIDEFVLYIEIEKNYSVNTVTSYEYDLQLFLTFLSDHGCSTCLDEITKTQVRCLRYLANDFTRGIDSPKTDDKLPVYKTLTDLK